MDNFPDTWNCFDCGQPGHLAANCPGKPRPKRHTWDKPIPPRQPGIPPTAEYLQARAELNRKLTGETQSNAPGD